MLYEVITDRLQDRYEFLTKTGSYKPKPVKKTVTKKKPVEKKINGKYVYASFQRPIWMGFDPGVPYRNRITSYNVCYTKLLRKLYIQYIYLQ